MSLRIRCLIGMVPLMGLLGCEEPFEAPVVEVTRTSDSDDLEDVTEPVPDDGEALVRPTCSYFLLREEDGQVAFAVDIEGADWTAVTLDVADEDNAWGLFLEEAGRSIAVPFDMSGSWTVEATVYTPDGTAWPCGHTSVRTAR